MKFDKALKEGYGKYLASDEETVSISKELLQLVQDLVSDEDIQKLAMSKHKSNPKLHRAVVKLFLDADFKHLFKKSSDEDEITYGKTNKSLNPSEIKYDVEDAVNKAAQTKKMGMGQVGAFGIGNKAYRAQKALDRREKASDGAINLFNKQTKEIEDAINNELTK